MPRGLRVPIVGTHHAMMSPARASSDATPATPRNAGSVSKMLLEYRKRVRALKTHPIANRLPSTGAPRRIPGENFARSERFQHSLSGPD
jgi:hypothetical protein